MAVRTGRIDRTRLQFTDLTERVNEEIIGFHDAAHLLRSLPATVPTTIADAITRMLQRSTAISAQHETFAKQVDS